MKDLPELSLSFDPLLQTVYGAIRARLLLTAIELRVFSHLTQPTSAEALAQQIKTHEDNTRLFLDALAANDLLAKKDGRYHNAPIADAFLVDGKPTYLGDVLLDDAEWLQPALEDLTGLVRSGPHPSGRPPHSIPGTKEAEIRANYQRAGIAQHIAGLISQLPEFPRMRKMLDLGSGAGLIGMAIVAAHPTMNGVLFDRPEIAEVAQRFIREYEIGDRITTIGSDYTTDSIGEGYDLVLTSYTLWRGTLDVTVGKIHAALNAAGVYVSLAESLTEERTRPTPLINSMVGVNLTGHDTMFDEGQVARAMLRAGFRSVQTRVAGGPQTHGSATIDIARK